MPDIMSDPLVSLFLFVLGIGIGIMSGLISIGGGLLTIPALLYLFPWTFPTHTPFGMQAITGIAATQSLASSSSSLRVHWSRGNVDKLLVLWVGGSCMIGSYLGGLSSGVFSDHILKIAYAALLFSVAAMFLLKKNHSPQPQEEAQKEAIDAHFSEDTNPRLASRRLSTVLTSLAIGYSAGLMGIGGAVFLIPLLHHYLKIPFRQTIGSTTGIVALTTLAAFTGKWQSDLVPLTDALLVALGSLVGGNLGAKLSFKTSDRVLSAIFVSFVLFTLARVLLEVLFGI